MGALRLLNERGRLRGSRAPRREHLHRSLMARLRVLALQSSLIGLCCYDRLGEGDRMLGRRQRLKMRRAGELFRTLGDCAPRGRPSCRARRLLDRERVRGRRLLRRSPLRRHELALRRARLIEMLRGLNLGQSLSMRPRRTLARGADLGLEKGGACRMRGTRAQQRRLCLAGSALDGTLNGHTLRRRALGCLRSSLRVELLLIRRGARRDHLQGRLALLLRRKEPWRRRLVTRESRHRSSRRVSRASIRTGASDDATESRSAFGGRGGASAAPSQVRRLLLHQQHLVSRLLRLLLFGELASLRLLDCALSLGSNFPCAGRRTSRDAELHLGVRDARHRRSGLRRLKFRGRRLGLGRRQVSDRYRLRRRRLGSWLRRRHAGHQRVRRREFERRRCSTAFRSHGWADGGSNGLHRRLADLWPRLGRSGRWPGRRG